MKVGDFALITYLDHVGGLETSLEPEVTYSAGWVQAINPTYVRLAQNFDGAKEMSFPFMVILKSTIISTHLMKMPKMKT